MWCTSSSRGALPQELQPRRDRVDFETLKPSTLRELGLPVTLLFAEEKETSRVPFGPLGWGWGVPSPQVKKRGWQVGVQRCPCTPISQAPLRIFS